MKRYTVDLYNKDADTYITVYETNSVTKAQAVREVLQELCRKDLIIDRTSVHTEPFDWAECYDHKEERKF